MDRTLLGEDAINGFVGHASDASEGDGSYDIHSMDGFTRNFRRGESNSWQPQETDQSNSWHRQGGVFQIPFQSANEFSASLPDESGGLIQRSNVFSGLETESGRQNIALQIPYQAVGPINGIWPSRGPVEVMTVPQVGAEQINGTWTRQSVPFYVTTNNADANTILRPGTIIQLPLQNQSSVYAPNYAWSDRVSSIRYSHTLEQFGNFPTSSAVPVNPPVYESVQVDPDRPVYSLSPGGQGMIFQTIPTQREAAAQESEVVYEYSGTPGGLMSQPVNIIYETETPKEEVRITENGQSQWEQNGETVQLPVYVNYEQGIEQSTYNGTAYDNAPNSSINNDLQYEVLTEPVSEEEGVQVYWDQNGQMVTVPNENIIQEVIPVEQEILIENNCEGNGETVEYEYASDVNDETIIEYVDEDAEQSIEVFLTGTPTSPKDNRLSHGDISFFEIGSHGMAHQKRGNLPVARKMHDANLNANTSPLFPLANDRSNYMKKSLFWKEAHIQLPEIMVLPSLRSLNSMPRGSPTPKAIDYKAASVATHFDECSRRTPFMTRNTHSSAKNKNRRKQKLFNKPGIENVLFDIQTYETSNSLKTITATEENHDSYSNMVLPDLDELLGRKKVADDKNNVECESHQKKTSQSNGKRSPFIPSSSTSYAARASVPYTSPNEVNTTVKCFKCAEFFPNVKSLVYHMNNCKGGEENNNETDKETNNYGNNNK